MLGRRAVLGGCGAATLLGIAGPLAAQSPASRADPAGPLLDQAKALPPAEGLRLLARIDPRSLTPARRLDVTTARAGLAIDVALAASPRDYGMRVARTLGDPGDLAAVAPRLDQELAGLHRQAGALFRRVGISGDTVGACYTALFADPRFLYPDTGEGRAAALTDMRRELARQRAITTAEIDGVPAFCLDPEIRGLSAAEMAAGKQGYREAPAPDRRGAYIVDLKELRRRPRWSLPSVVAHELLPGHMAQLAFEASAPPHPLRLIYTAAFFEGWAIHAEHLAAANGAFADPLAMLGHLHWLIFRIARARIDLGIHREGWTPAAARERLVAWQGEPVYFAAFDGDIARIVRDPGIRVAEALAWLALDEQAPVARRARQRWHRDMLSLGRKRLDAPGGGKQ